MDYRAIRMQRVERPYLPPFYIAHVIINGQPCICGGGDTEAEAIEDAKREYQRLGAPVIQQK